MSFWLIFNINYMSFDLTKWSHRLDWILTNAVKQQQQQHQYNKPQQPSPHHYTMTRPLFRTCFAPRNHKSQKTTTTTIILTQNPRRFLALLINVYPIFSVFLSRFSHSRTTSFPALTSSLYITKLGVGASNTK